MSDLPYCCDNCVGATICEVHGYTTKISTTQLDTLIEGLEQYANQGIYDPWYLADGSIVQPLDSLRELRALRREFITKINLV